MRALAYLNKYLLKHKYYLIGGTIFIFIGNTFALLPAMLVREAFDIVAGNVQLSWAYADHNSNNYLLEGLFLYGLFIVLMVFIRGVFLFMMRQTIIVMSRHIEYELKNEMYAHYQVLPRTFYRQQHTGDLLARLSEDVSRVRMYLGPAIMYGINLLSLLCILIPFMFSINVTLAAYVLLPLPLLSISIYYINNKINRHSERIQRQLSGLSSFTQEAFSGIRVIQSFAKEKSFTQAFARQSLDYRKKSMSLVFIESLFFPLMICLIGLSVIAAVYVGAQQVVVGSLSVGNIAEFIIYINMLTWPVTSLGWASSLVQRAAASQQRINEFLQAKTHISSGTLVKTHIAGEVVFQSVSFTYGEQKRPALHHVSFTLPKSTSLAVMGEIGSGKTTLVQLMIRLDVPQEGRVLIDQQDIEVYDPHFLRSQIGYVPQDSFLFSDTIERNIAFGWPKATEEDVYEAAQEAALLSTIEAMPEGLQTVVGERGIMLSGGQKQRVCIARALIRKPRILILDDALSAVDTHTEHLILSSISKHMQERTVLIVSHRASSAKLADQILVLEEGKVLEQGTPTALLQQKNSYYKRLYEVQLKKETYRS